MTAGLFLLTLLGTQLAVSSATRTSPTKLVIGVDGGTESIRACCFDALTGKVVGKPKSVPYPTYHPEPGWAEQDPRDWYENLGAAVRGVVSSLPFFTKWEICAICLDTTCCSVVALDEKMEPLRNSLLWMDARSAEQTKQIMEKAKGDPALKVNCNGKGPLSAEWMTPKSLWIKQNDPDVWKNAKTVCEYQDYLNYKLTGVMCASSCNAAARWHWNGDECTKGPKLGRPLSLYSKIGIPELADKLPLKCYPPGALIGRLHQEAAAHLGLPEGLPVAQGGPDAFIGMVGLGCITPGQLCLITGSSHLHCVVSSKPRTAEGTWGAYKGAPIPGINFAEGGQSSTGSIIRWAKRLFGELVDFKTLDEEASAISPGSEGLVALETFQGSRTPVTDPLARGALVGLSLAHSRSHIWRALMEAVCFGTRACIESLEAAGHKCEEIIIAGGATRSPLWLQMHSDVTGKTVVVCENTDAPLLGCAILASVGAGVHPNIECAVAAMVRTSERLEPNEETMALYNTLYSEVYKKVSPALTKSVVHSIARIRGGGTDQNLQPDPIISPSLLACDWADIKGEVRRCIESGVPHLHVDIFDGVYLDSPLAFTFGPKMVSAIRKTCGELRARSAVIDLHMCVERPDRFVEVMASAGASRFIFQWEAIDGDDHSERVLSALSLARKIRAAGMKCGISINPQTAPKELYTLLNFGLIDLVDILAVEPGFGGQAFQAIALDKVRQLVEWRRKSSSESAKQLLIMVDGGVNTETSPKVIDAGADILVAGSFLFRNDDLSEAIIALKSAVHSSAT